MPSTSNNSLLNRADALTVRHLTPGNGVSAPPRVTAQSPLHEVLIEEVAALLPNPVATALRTAPTVGQVNDWLAVGGLYSWAARDPYLAQRFLAEVGTQPREAGLALIRAEASRMEPPPRDAAWHARDHDGLLLQLGAAVVLLVLRGLLLYLFLAWGTPWRQPFDWLNWLHDPAGLGLLSRPLSNDPVLPIVLAVAALWLGLEAVLAPWLLEALRQLPAKSCALPPPLSWRADAFHALWVGQALVLLTWSWARCVLWVAWWGDGIGSTAGQIALAVGALLLFLGEFLAVMRRLRRTLRLGGAALEGW